MFLNAGMNESSSPTVRDEAREAQKLCEEPGGFHAYFKVSENAPCWAPPFVGKVSNRSHQNFLMSHSKKEMLFFIRLKLFTVREPLLKIMSFLFLVFKMSLQH